MAKFLILAILTIAMLVHLWVCAVLVLPFGMAEPGQPHGWGPLAVFWAIGESCWTWWKFARGRSDAIPTSTRLMAAAAAFLILLVGDASAMGLSDSNKWDAAAWVGGLVAIAGCRASRYLLRSSSA